MARRYDFPYSDYLVSNSYINQAVMQFVFEGEEFKGVGTRDESGIMEYFPEITEMIKYLIKLDELPKRFLDEVNEYDSVLMAVTGGDLWITFSRLVPPKDQGGIGHFKGGFKIIISATKDDISFTLRSK